jgi:hypothetical protein
VNLVKHRTRAPRSLWLRAAAAAHVLHVLQANRTSFSSAEKLAGFAPLHLPRPLRKRDAPHLLFGIQYRNSKADPRWKTVLHHRALG